MLNTTLVHKCVLHLYTFTPFLHSNKKPHSHCPRAWRDAGAHILQNTCLSNCTRHARRCTWIQHSVHRITFAPCHAAEFYALLSCVYIFAYVYICIQLVRGNVWHAAAATRKKKCIHKINSHTTAQLDPVLALTVRWKANKCASKFHALFIVCSCRMYSCWCWNC